MWRIARRLRWRARLRRRGICFLPCSVVLAGLEVSFGRIGGVVGPR